MGIIRLNSNAYENGEEYVDRLQNETVKNFGILLALLSSYYKARVDGPLYMRSIKAMSIALSQLRINLNNIYDDNDYEATRGEFINQVITYLAFPDDPVDLNASDVEFRTFLVEIIKLYFKGSIPDSIKAGVSLITKKDVGLIVHYEEARKPGSGYDISDEFGFTVDIVLNNPSDIDVFRADKNIVIFLNILRPAHTLYTIRYILKDAYLGNQAIPYVGPRPPPKIKDEFTFILNDYKYQDFRKFVSGVYGVDPGGFKKSYSATFEDHSSDF